MKRYLKAKGALDDAADEQLRAEIRDGLQRALKEAEAYPAKPPVESMFEDVYAEPTPQLREQLAELEEAMASDPRVANPRHSDS
jgi:2-oxoisovalerate dehydrogenase E1 component alpha subunit